MKKNSKSADLVISIHGDAGTPTNNGVVVIYSVETKKNKFMGDYGNEFAESFTNFLKTKYTVVPVQIKTAPGYTKIDHPSILTGNSEPNYPPAIIIETGFMQNPEEVDRLTDTTKQDELVKAIADSLVEYIHSKALVASK